MQLTSFLKYFFTPAIGGIWAFATLGIFQVNLHLPRPLLLCATSCQNTTQFFQERMWNSSTAFELHSSPFRDRRLNKTRKFHDKVWCFARETLLERSKLAYCVACDKSRKAMSTNTIIFHSGRHIFSKLCSHQSLIFFFFFNFYFRQRPKETGGQT